MTRRVNNWRLTWYKVFWLGRLFCWHGNKYLRYSAASNGGALYCDRCGLKRVGWVYDPEESI